MLDLGHFWTRSEEQAEEGDWLSGHLVLWAGVRSTAQGQMKRLRLLDPLRVNYIGSFVGHFRLSSICLSYVASYSSYAAVSRRLVASNHRFPLAQATSCRLHFNPRFRQRHLNIFLYLVYSFDIV